MDTGFNYARINWSTEYWGFLPVFWKWKLGKGKALEGKVLHHVLALKNLSQVLTIDLREPTCCLNPFSVSHLVCPRPTKGYLWLSHYSWFCLRQCKELLFIWEGLSWDCVKQFSPANWGKKLPEWLEQPPTRVDGSRTLVSGQQASTVTGILLCLPFLRRALRCRKSSCLVGLFFGMHPDTHTMIPVWVASQNRESKCKTRLSNSIQGRKTPVAAMKLDVYDLLFVYIINLALRAIFCEHDFWNKT